MPGGVTLMPTLGRLKAVRESKFLTQEMLAERSGVSRPNIARLERGDEEARFTTIWKLANALSVEPDELLGDREEETPQP
jgi:XRE family transcriptional regulator, regulator of sulfur utilization